VIIDVPNPELKLRPGMTATVSILVARRDDVLRIPALALRFQPPPDAMPADMAQSDVKSQPDGSKPRGGGDMPPQCQSHDSTQRYRRMGDEQGGPQGDHQGWRHRGDEQQGDASSKKKMVRVWVLDGSKLRQVRVAVGLTDNRYVELLGSELKEGDDIVLATL